MKMYLDLMVFTQEIIYKHSINGQSTDNVWSYAISLAECKLIATHRIALYVNDKNVTNFVSLGVEYISK